MPITLHGIPNCDTVKKARTWLDQAGIVYRFHDFRKEGLDPAALGRWVAEHGWETVLNRAGTTFRALPREQTQDLDADRAIALMLAQPSLIKRPVLDRDGETTIGFKPERYQALFGR